MGAIVLFPLLLPFIPAKEFASKGMLLGVILALPFVLYPLLNGASIDSRFLLNGATYILIMAPIVSFLSLNYTGSSTFTSRTGVKREIFRWVPIMVIMLVAGVVIQIVALLLEAGGYV
jgi:hypothetical protein